MVSGNQKYVSQPYEFWKVRLVTDSEVALRTDTVDNSFSKPNAETTFIYGRRSVTDGVLLAMFTYTIVFDSLVFILVTWKLAFPLIRHTPLVSGMVKDGLMYILLV